MSRKCPTADDIASLEYDLVDSAVAFLTRSVQTISDSDDEHSVAFAVVDLATTVEVLMKARLVRKDWTEVCTIDRLARTDPPVHTTMLFDTARELGGSIADPAGRMGACRPRPHRARHRTR